MREGDEAARGLERNASNVIPGGVDIEEGEMAVRGGRTAESLVFAWLVMLIVVDGVGWLTLGRLSFVKLTYGE